jgi:hypothetical protein
MRHDLNDRPRAARRQRRKRPITSTNEAKTQRHFGSHTKQRIVRIWQQSAVSAETGPTNTGCSVSNRLTAEIVRVGISYKFGGN